MKYYLENISKHYYFAYVGKFNPFHSGHKHVYDYLTELMMRYNLPGAVYICTKLDNKGFLTGEQRKKIIELSGVAHERIIDVGGYNIPRLLNAMAGGIPSESSVIVTAFSQKDLDDQEVTAKKEEKTKPTFTSKTQDESKKTFKGSKRALITPPADNITSWRVVNDISHIPYLRPYTFVHKEYEQVREQKIKKGTGYILIVPTQQTADKNIISSSYIRTLVEAGEWNKIMNVMATREAFEFLQQIKRKD